MKNILLIAFTALLFSCSDSPNAEKENLAATEFKSQYNPEKDVLVDVRTEEEYQSGHFTTARHADFTNGELEKEMQNWDKDKTYYLHCASGGRSGKATKMMRENGFKNVYNIGGYEEVKATGVPASE